MSKGGRNTSVRLFYSQVYQPRQKVGSGETKMSGNQGGLTFATRIKRLHVHPTILAQQYISERNIENYNSYTTRNVDVTAKGKLAYKLHSALSLSVLGGYDLNTYEMDSKTTQKRLFYQMSLDLNKRFENFSVFGSAAYQRDSSSIADHRYSPSPQQRFKTNSLIGTLGFSFKDFLWIRSSIQSNKLSLLPQDSKIYPSYFASLDILKATRKEEGSLSKFVYEGITTALITTQDYLPQR